MQMKVLMRARRRRKQLQQQPLQRKLNHEEANEFA